MADSNWSLGPNPENQELTKNPYLKKGNPLFTHSAKKSDIINASLDSVTTSDSMGHQKVDSPNSSMKTHEKNVLPYENLESKILFARNPFVVSLKSTDSPNGFLLPKWAQNNTSSSKAQDL